MDSFWLPAETKDLRPEEERMPYHPVAVSSLIVRGLIDQAQLKDVEDDVLTQFPKIDGHTLWESYNIALLALTLGGEATADR
jgi:predicted nuclease of restriction endonuclease-like RecB superfamily